MRGGSEVEDEAVDDGDVEPVEVSEDAKDLPLEEVMASSGLFGEFEGAKAHSEGAINDGIEPKEVSDDDYGSLIVFEDGDQRDNGGEGEEAHGGAVLDGESFGGAGSLSSDSELFDIHGTSALRERYGAAESADGLSDDEVFPVVSVLEDSEQHIVEQHGLRDTAEEKTESSEAYTSQTSDSDSEIHATSGPEHTNDSDSFKQVNDNEELPVASASKDLGQHVLEQPEDLHETTTQESDLSDIDTSQPSGSESDMHTTPATKQSDDTDSFEKVSDGEKLSVMSTPSDSDQHIFEQHDLHEHAMQGSDLSASDAFQSSGSDSDIDTTSDPKQPGDTDRIEKLGNEQYADVPSPKDVGQQIFEQKNPHETTIQETELSDTEVSHTSDSDVSDMQLPTTITIRGPFLNIAERGRTLERGATVSREMVLRGLIRDAHPEMIHFTLPHSMFSPDDLRNGLQYAYSMLQVATSKLAILALLDDETTNMTGSDLRRWVELADNLNLRNRSESRISVIFESLSIGEMKAALEELVQSRLVLEGEVEKAQMLLMGKVVAKERHEKSAVIPAKRAAELDQEGGISTKKRRVCEENNETALDAFLTAIMVVLISVLYLCVHEWPIGSVGDRWMNMKT